MPKQPTIMQRLMSERILLGGVAMTRQQAVDMLAKEGCSRQCIDTTVFGPRAVVVQEQGCIDCQQKLPFVKTGKAYERDTELYECDNPDYLHEVCRQHLQSLYTLGDYCSACSERQKGYMK